MRPRGVTGAEPDHAPDTDLKRIRQALGLLPSSGCDIPRLPCHRRGLCTRRSSDPRRVGVPEAARQDVGQDVSGTLRKRRLRMLRKVMLSTNM